MADGFLRDMLAVLAEHAPVTADIYRRTRGVESATGGRVVVRSGDRRSILDIHGAGGELPAEFSLDLAEGVVDWRFDGESDQPVAEDNLAALRVFALLDPRFVASEMDRVRTFPTGRLLRILGYLRLDHMAIHLPENYLEFLKDAPLRGWADWAWDGNSGYEPQHPLDHPVAFIFDQSTGRLIEIRQPDLFPRTEDVIIERFAPYG